MMTALPAVLELAYKPGIFIFEMAWKSTIILGSVVLLGELLKHRSASFKQMVYSTGILTMLCFILITPISPRWTINTLDWPSVFSSKKITLNQPVVDGESQSFRSKDGSPGVGTDSN